MVRTQIQLTEDQLKALRSVSAATGKSVAELVRQGVDRYLAARNQITREERIERAIRVAGRFSSGFADISLKHDQHLADAFGR